MKYKEVIGNLIKVSGKSKYRVSKEYGQEISQYIGKDIRISTLIRICDLLGCDVLIQNRENKKCVRVENDR